MDRVTTMPIDQGEIPTDKIKCPNCGELIPLTATLQHQLREQARAELKKELVEQQKALTARERDLQTKEEALSTAEASLENRVHEALASEKAKIAAGERKKAEEAVAVEVKDLRAQALERDRQLHEAQEKELKFRKEKRELEERHKSLELEVARKLDEERDQIREKAVEEALEEHSRKDAEKDRKLQEAFKANEELRRKLQQGSQQTQGEIPEEQLEELLRSTFPTDDIEPVAKGAKGGDIIQRVISRSGHPCGAILWESKRTKTWSDGWMEKLKDDQRAAKADIAVIVTDALPRDIKTFGMKDGIWVTTPQFVQGLASAIHVQLTQVALTKVAAAGKNEKIETLFNYLTGPEFKQRVEAIVETFTAMQQELAAERKLFEKRWAKREKQLQRVIANTAGMYGDLEGLIGTPMQSIPALEAGEEDDFEAEDAATEEHLEDE